MSINLRTQRKRNERGKNCHNELKDEWMYREITHLFSPELQSKTSVQVEEKYFKGKRNDI